MTTHEKPAPEHDRDALLLEIADRHLFLETLETRNSDRLEAAFEAGCRARADASIQS